MKKYFVITSLLLSMLTSSLAFASDMTLTLSVPGMNRPSCPYMPEQLHSSVKSLQSAEANLESRTVDVAFNDAIASVDNLLGANTAIGYGSSVLAIGEGS